VFGIPDGPHPARSLLGARLLSRRGTAEHLGAGDDCIRISSAATALGLGLAKELWDSRGDGVFDFADLAADIAGTAAGYAAVEHFIAED